MLYAAIKLEHVSDDIAWQHKRGGMKRDFQRWLRDWKKLGSNKAFTSVAQIHAGDKREPVQGVPDYDNANHTGSRGVFYWYTLAPGLYEINHRYKINAVRRYWLLSENGTTREVTRDEANQWLTTQNTNAT